LSSTSRSGRSCFSGSGSTKVKTRTNHPNRSMKPTAPLRHKFSVFATTPCRGLSLSC
jgi:hypothetical protein